MVREEARCAAFITSTEIDFKETGPISLKDQVREAVFDTFLAGAKFGYSKGYEDGYQRAIELLREEKSLQSFREYGNSQLHWAEWLEKRKE